ncbi:NuA4-domain-containing protein [Plenodomus tracheiphilus IPT5]|uniref:Chromatin modification-related protein EAF6 n=1 Tax=Plenodomus tracheiphilus IPT5 TaxID=1408161 RepID=A0A6A7B8W3_9PLEO|nr:NuA4-domain-containing protein [Plenodomus tracheiphilus IPT5]
MAENAPPGSSANAGADGSRGMPYYEKLRRDLRDSLNKKRGIDAQLSHIEDNITRMETSYLEETSAGNIIKGFDNYIKGAATTTTTSGAGTATRRKAPISDTDRIFSRSSTSFLREASTPATTPSHAPTPTSSFPTRENSQVTTNGNKMGSGSKKKKTTEDEEDEGSKSKRQKVSYGRE